MEKGKPNIKKTSINCSILGHSPQTTPSKGAEYDFYLVILYMLPSTLIEYYLKEMLYAPIYGHNLMERSLIVILMLKL